MQRQFLLTVMHTRNHKKSKIVEKFPTFLNTVFQTHFGTVGIGTAPFFRTRGLPAPNFHLFFYFEGDDGRESIFLDGVHA